MIQGKPHLTHVIQALLTGIGALAVRQVHQGPRAAQLIQSPRLACARRDAKRLEGTRRDNQFATRGIPIRAALNAQHLQPDDGKQQGDDC